MRFRKLPSGLVINLDHVVSMRVKDEGPIKRVLVTCVMHEDGYGHEFFDADADALQAFIGREVAPFDSVGA